MATRTGKLLTQEERELCKKIAGLKIVLVSRRAQALLMLDDGNTQVKSAQLSSLTLGQLRYLLRLFKTKRINLFPQTILPKPEEQEIETTPAPVPEISGENPAEEVAEKKEKIKDKKKKKKKKGKNKKAKQLKEEKSKKGKKKDKKKKKKKKKTLK